MIYAQIKAVPRWHHWLTPVMFLAFALAGGAMLSGQRAGRRWRWSLVGGGAAGGLARGRRAPLPRAGQTMGTATGLDRLGTPSVLRTRRIPAGTTCMREMIFVVGRKHAREAARGSRWRWPRSCLR